VSNGAGANSSGSGAGSAGTQFSGSTAPVLVPGGEPGSLVHSSNGFGSSSAIPGVDAPPVSGLGAVQSNASQAPLLAIGLGILLLGVGGYIGRRAWRPSRRADSPPAA
jgi:hypothetical protein